MLDFIMFIIYTFAMMATLMILGEMMWEGLKNFYRIWKGR